MLVHRLVAEAYVPNPGNLPQVNHINGNRSDNRIENLEWCNNAGNIQNAMERGAFDFKGSKHRLAKLDEGKVSLINKMLSDKIPQKEIASKFGVAQSQISTIHTRQGWKHVM